MYVVCGDGEGVYHLRYCSLEETLRELSSLGLNGQIIKVCVCVCVCVCACVCARVCVCLCVHACTLSVCMVCACVCVCMRACVCVCGMCGVSWHDVP